MSYLVAFPWLEANMDSSPIALKQFDILHNNSYFFAALLLRIDKLNNLWTIHFYFQWKYTSIDSKY